MELINIKEISSIETFDKEIKPKQYHYYYEKGWKFLWWTITKKGWYRRELFLPYLIPSEYLGEDKPKDEIEYTKARCTIMMNNTASSTKEFDTHQEALQYAERIRSKCCNTIQLTEL